MLTITAAGCAKEQGVSYVEPCEYLRIHVRADSNAGADQKIKLLVKDEIVRSLTPYLKDCKSKKEAMIAAERKIALVESVANSLLKERGFSYRASVRLGREVFPTRVYEEITLPFGEYDCLIVELGSGKGDNWWCVMYPPLCFSGGEKVEYRSKIAELFQKLFSRRRTT